jgi:hypothetical protein
MKAYTIKNIKVWELYKSRLAPSYFRCSKDFQKIKKFRQMTNSFSLCHRRTQMPSKNGVYLHEVQYQSQSAFSQGQVGRFRKVYDCMNTTINNSFQEFTFNSKNKSTE